ncbi:MAG: RsmD family RNA methyltransferase [Alistipes sp.]|nr:RsmD family RNA methyltransferase [Alistipes sp.]
MIIPSEFELYRLPDFIEAVEANIDRDPEAIALDKRIPFARDLATRVKYLQRSRAKLPSYYEARCVIPARAYQQSTGETVALEKGLSGKLCLDLTCGLGVDSFAMSRTSGRVITLERDPLLAEVARYNFKLLGASNIEVVTSPAKEFLAAYPDLRADIVYADPDRRTADGRRVAALEECSPDIQALLPVLKRTAPRVVIKLSPLFDIHEAFRIFGPGTKITVVSDKGECKEVLVETGEAVTGQWVEARITGSGSLTERYCGTPGLITVPAGPGIEKARYMAVPDVALVKSAIAPVYYASLGWGMTSQHGLAYGSEPLPQFGSRLYGIDKIMPFNPRKIKAFLRTAGIERLNLIMRDMPGGTAHAARQLGIMEGGTRFAAVVAAGGIRYFILLADQAGGDME